MSDFSPTEAALEGLRITRERPLAVLWWWLAYVAITLVEFAVSLAPPFKRLPSVMKDVESSLNVLQGSPNDAIASQHVMTGLGQMIPPFLIFIVLALSLQVILSTAVLRAVLRPADRAFGYLRVSMDEARQLGLVALIGAAVIGYAFLVSLVSSIVLGIVGGLAGGISPMVAAPVVQAILLAAFLYPAVRLSLASAMTFAEERVSFMRSWALTKGRFWSLLGAYTLAVIFVLIVWLAITAMKKVLVVLLAGGVEPMPQSFAELLAPLPLCVFLVNGLFAALVGAIQVAPLAHAFRQLGGRAEAAPAVKSAVGSPWS